MTKSHWEDVYKRKLPSDVSWFQPHLAKSLEFIDETDIGKSARIIDVGGGASTLADDLLERGFDHLTVLDLSSEAIRLSQKRLGEKAGRVTWLAADILEINLPRQAFDLWHDRAVFHFLTDEEERKAYIAALKKALKPGGFVVMAVFSLEGPEKCSGLDVVRHSAETLSREFGQGFTLLKSCPERHQTPFGMFQHFIYCLFHAKAHESGLSKPTERASS